MTIILASQSPRRQELLRYITTDFKTIPADIDETIPQGMKPKDYALAMAEEKARVVSEEYPKDVVIGSDTIVAVSDDIMGKPKDEQDAYHMLAKLSGSSHQVHTSVCLRQGSRSLTKVFTATVTFFELSSEEIEQYIQTGEPLDKAGAYGIQGPAAVFVKEVIGDYYAIVGFPIGQVNQLLKQFQG